MSGLAEFSLIKQYFEKCTHSRDDVLLGIGDDCAIVQSKDNQQLAVSVDTLVEGIHFSPDVDAYSLGHKSLAVSLSDLAAMGATPAWFTLALTLPDINPPWLTDFANGLANIANQHHIALIGGDTTRGPLSITIQVHGFVSAKKALRRDGAQPGDDIYVSGTLGDAGAGLKLKQRELRSDDLLINAKAENFIEQRLDRPIPRVQLGLNIVNIATAAIDISDGLVADLGHILEKSHVGAEINIDALPLSPQLLTLVNRQQAEHFALYSGDDYELCFTAPLEKQSELTRMACTKIGTVNESGKLTFIQQGQTIELTGAGYEHFSTEH
ncbi:UNVERIFIED_CONTAM: hypothetical protein GTU68_001394 [Idotea baltica]|nr:hypothetical protein [Idotea baltica]